MFDLGDPRVGHDVLGKRKFSALEEEIKDFHCTPSIFPVIISRRKRWAGSVACMVERKCV